MSDFEPGAIEAMKWLNQEVRAFYALGGDTHVRGKVIAYCVAPTVVIETEDGETVSWRADLVELENGVPQREREVDM